MSKAKTCLAGPMTAGLGKAVTFFRLFFRLWADEDMMAESLGSIVTH